MECKYCKTQNKDDYIYCMNCGRKLHQKESSFDPKSLLKNKFVLIGVALAAALLLLLALNPFGSGKTSSVSEEISIPRTKPQIYSENENVYIYDGMTKIETFEGSSSGNKQYSFDNQAAAFSISKEDVNELYVLYKGKTSKVTDDFTEFKISDSGENILYHSESDGSIHLYNCKNKKDKTVVSAEEEPEGVEAVTLSYTGDKFGFVRLIDGDDHVYLYSSSGVKEIPVEGFMSIQAVSEKGEVFYLNFEDEALYVCDGTNNTLICEDYEILTFNREYSQVAVVENEEFVLYKNGTVLRTEAEGIDSAYSIIVPQRILGSIYVTYDSYGEHKPIYHIGVGGFENHYYQTKDKDLVYLGKDLERKMICEKAGAYLLSNDGKILFYTDEEGLLHRYENKDEIVSEEPLDLKQFYAWDSVNKGLYFLTNSKELTYLDDEDLKIVGSNKVEQGICCNDGYFYFKDGSKFYASRKGEEAVEVGELKGSSLNYTGYDFIGIDGISYQGKDKDVYFIKDGEAHKLDIGGEKQEGEA